MSLLLLMANCNWSGCGGGGKRCNISASKKDRVRAKSTVFHLRYSCKGPVRCLITVTLLSMENCNEKVGASSDSRNVFSYFVSHAARGNVWLPCVKVLTFFQYSSATNSRSPARKCRGEEQRPLNNSAQLNGRGL